ncbi:nuclear transport factor 2 family protein [Nocardia puris]|uniref:nuclear transport factor 2 family protein n=1 Tax=Nocardia puris TaxID=208602 RepID=UPI0018934798|nr:nuclear transport factor 2 family protein [Nocardia puris]MBF6213195.1 nuclear transport factor 2 family protein [Nocardia puris]MBF6370134.1 nuclear transport factor 2 family protein [Nocardia puris]MBF6462074.1 nuclear transport factor 2 family protein [Nocardia puris]
MNKIRRLLPLAVLPLTLLAAACTVTSASRADTAQDPEIRALLDRAEITALADRLGIALDDGRFDDFRAIYAADATATTPGGTARGVDALIAQAGRNHSPDLRIQHFISNVRIDLRGDAATVRANLVVVFAPAGPLAAPGYTLGSIYHFDAARTSDGWRLTSVRTEPRWAVGTRP